MRKEAVMIRVIRCLSFESQPRTPLVGTDILIAIIYVYPEPSLD